MLNHISVGATSLTSAKAFYDATLSTLGYRCLSEDMNAVGHGDNNIEFWVLKAKKPVPDEDNSELHICFHPAARV